MQELLHCGVFTLLWNYLRREKRKSFEESPGRAHLPLHWPITETPTRWGSRQMMIQRVLGQEALSQVLKEDRKPDTWYPLGKIQMSWNL